MIPCVSGCSAIPPPAGAAGGYSVVLFSWAQTDQAAALSATASLPAGPERDGGLGEVLAHWAARPVRGSIRQSASAWCHRPGIAHDHGEGSGEVRSHHDGTQARNPRCGAARTNRLRGRQVLGRTRSCRRIRLGASSRSFARGFRDCEHPEHSLRNVRRSRHGDRPDSPFSAAMREKPDATPAWVRALPPV